MRTIPLSWKIGAGVVAAVLLITVWNLFAAYQAQRRADELVHEAARVAQQNARQAQVRARQHHDKLAQRLQQHRETLHNNYQEITQQARTYRAVEAAREVARQQAARQVAASFVLDANQQCVGGIVIEREGSRYSQTLGPSGHRVECKGRKAAQPLR